MIDIENKVLNTVFNAVQAAYSTASCYGEYVSVPAAFPCVTLYESDSRTYTQSNDEQLHEHQAIVTYECNVYSLEIIIMLEQLDLNLLTSICVIRSGTTG